MSTALDAPDPGSLRLGRHRRPPSTRLGALAIKPRTVARLERHRVRTIAELLAIGVDGLVALHYSERTIAGVVLHVRAAGYDVPGSAPAGGPVVARCHCPACGWRKVIPRARIGTPCPICRGTIEGPRTGRRPRPPESRMVALRLRVSPSMLAAIGAGPRGLCRRVRQLLALGLLAERADPPRGGRAHDIRAPL